MNSKQFLLTGTVFFLLGTFVGNTVQTEVSPANTLTRMIWAADSATPSQSDASSVSAATAFKGMRVQMRQAADHQRRAHCGGHVGRARSFR